MTIYEIASGAPPHANLPANRLGKALHSRPPRLTEDKFSRELCEFVEFVAQAEPENRPSIQQILDHPYIRDSEVTHPTFMLKDLVDNYDDWKYSGGQRTSLFLSSGAPAPSEFGGGSSDDSGDWIFSTSQHALVSTSRDALAEHDQSYDPNAEVPEEPHPLPSMQVNPTIGFSFSGNLDDLSADPPDDFTSRPTKQTASLDIQTPDPSTERRVARGGQALDAIFNPSQQPYEYGVRIGDMPLDKPILSRAKSDLPLRNHNGSSDDLARKEVDFNESASKSDVEIADADTIKQKRKQQPKEKRETMTMNWQPDWDNVESNQDSEPDPMPGPPSAFPMARPTLMHAETAPDKIAQLRASTATMNLDDMMGDDDWMSGSAMGRSPAISTPLEDEDITIRHNITDLTDSSFESYASSVADTSASEDEAYPAPSQELNGHRRRELIQHPDMHEDIAPPSAAVMRDGAPQSVVAAELGRIMEGFVGELGALKVEFPNEHDLDDEYDGDDDSEEGEVDDDEINNPIVN